MSEKGIQVAVVGASGYTGQKLLRLLVMHSRVDLVAVNSRQEAGKKLTDLFSSLRGIKYKRSCHSGLTYSCFPKLLSRLLIKPKQNR